MSVLSYAIIGTGAIGGYYGGRLQQAGCDVHFLLRSNYQHVQESGLHVESVDGDFVLPQVNAYSNPADMPPVDVVIVALKTTNNHLLWKLLPKIKPGGAILSLQNGFGVEGAIAQQLKEKGLAVPTLLGGLCFICSNKVGPGHIHHLDYGQILLGVHTEDHQPCAPTPVLKSIEADFSSVNVATEITNDLPMARWQKLIWNVPFNGLSVVLDATTEEMMVESKTRTGEPAALRSLITILMEEVAAIANAWGEKTSPGAHRTLPAGIIAQMLAHTEEMPPYRTSMKIDYDEGRALEIEAILGSPIRIADQLGIATPRMNMLYQQLNFLDCANRSS